MGFPYQQAPGQRAKNVNHENALCHLTVQSAPKSPLHLLINTFTEHLWSAHMHQIAIPNLKPLCMFGSEGVAITLSTSQLSS